MTMEEHDSEKKEKVERKEGTLDVAFKRPNDLWRSGSNMCEAERRSLFRPVHIGADVGSSAKRLRGNAARRQWTSKDLALTSAVDYHQSKPL